MMKRFSLLLCSLLFVLGFFGYANALIFTLDHYDIDHIIDDPGLVLDHNELLPEPYAFPNLEVGDIATVNLFELWTTESAVNTEDDLDPKEISVYLDFTLFDGDIEGSTFGIRGGLAGSYQAGVVEWDGPAIFSFGPLGDGALQATLSDEIFNEGYFWGTGNATATVQLTLEYLTAPSEEGPAPVPEPGTWLLLGLGLAGLAGYRRFKKS